jgi:hypothetical protein
MDPNFAKTAPGVMTASWMHTKSVVCRSGPAVSRDQGSSSIPRI